MNIVKLLQNYISDVFFYYRADITRIITILIDTESRFVPPLMVSTDEKNRSSLSLSTTVVAHFFPPVRLLRCRLIIIAVLLNQGSRNWHAFGL